MNLAGAMGVSVGILVVELVAGIAGNSLALLADAGHVFADVSGMAVSLGAVWLANRPASTGRSYGLYRLEILAAAANALLLLAVSILILWEGVRRLAAPADIDFGAGIGRGRRGPRGEPGLDPAAGAGPQVAAFFTEGMTTIHSALSSKFCGIPSGFLRTSCITLPEFFTLSDSLSAAKPGTVRTRTIPKPNSIFLITSPISPQVFGSSLERVSDTTDSALICSFPNTERGDSC